MLAHLCQNLIQCSLSSLTFGFKALKGFLHLLTYIQALVVVSPFVVIMAIFLPCAFYLTDIKDDFNDINFPADIEYHDAYLEQIDSRSHTQRRRG